MTNKEESSNPVPQGKYVPASRSGKIIYTAGMTPRYKGALIQSGKIMTNQPLNTYKKAVNQATSNALLAVNNMLIENESIEQILILNVYINAQETFKAHSILADIASEYLYEELSETAIGSRAAVGVASLPDDAPIEIQIIAVVSDD